MRPGLLFRAASGAGEIERSAILFPKLGTVAPSDGSFCFLALASSPVERIVAAAFVGTEPPCVGHFTWDIAPAWARAAKDFLEALVREAKMRGLAELVTEGMVDEQSPQAHALRDAGFAPRTSNSVFRLEAAAAARRIAATMARSKPRLAAQDLELSSPVKASADAVWEFLQPFRLIGQQDFRDDLAAGAYREFSGVLRAGGGIRGVLLAKRAGPDSVRIPVFAVERGGNAFAGVHGGRSGGATDRLLHAAARL